MNKTYKFKTAGCRNPLSWNVTTRCSSNVHVLLTDNQRLIIDFSKNGDYKYMPVISGEDISTSTELSFEISSEDGFEFSFNSYCNLMNDGTSMGYTHICNGCRTSEGKVETVQIEINSIAERLEWETNEEFIAYIYCRYLLNKNNVITNYLSDNNVKQFVEQIQSLIDLANSKNTKFRFDEWYISQLANVKSATERDALLFSILKAYDDMLNDLPNNDLEYVQYNNLLFVIGRKQWYEDRMTLGSCPFQNIRGIILNNEELSNFSTTHSIIGNKRLFDETGNLIAAAGHASSSACLGMDATRSLNFRNIGIHVYEGASSETVDEILNKSVVNSRDAKILILPELFVNHEKIASLINILDANTNSSNLELVVAGSYYKEHGTQFTNTATFLSKGAGNKWGILGEYNKVFPFSMGYSGNVANEYNISTKAYPIADYDLLLEDLYLDGNISILGYQDCVVGIAICRDAMDLLDARNPLHRYCDFVDVMLVISDNSGQSNMFSGVGECLARWHNCAMLYTNAVNEASDETSEKFLEISFGLYPYKNRKSSSSTSLSGVLSYKGKMVLQGTDGYSIIPSLGILNSSGIKYVQLSEQELENCVKLYTFENFNCQNNK